MGFEKRLSFEHHITNKMQKMKMQKIILLIGCLAASVVSDAQGGVRFGEKIILGTSLTYIWEDNKPFVENFYQEITWDKNIAISLSSSLYAGLMHKSIFTSGSRYFEDQNERNRYNMTGLFIHYDVLPRSQHRLFGELSYLVGDYCTCGPTDPYRVRNLNYWGWGFGYDLPLWRGFSLDLAFNAHYILNDIATKYSFTQYVVGLNYAIDFKRK